MAVLSLPPREVGGWNQQFGDPQSTSHVASNVTHTANWNISFECFVPWLESATEDQSAHCVGSQLANKHRYFLPVQENFRRKLLSPPLLLCTCIHRHTHTALHTCTIHSVGGTSLCSGRIRKCTVTHCGMGTLWHTVGWVHCNQGRKNQHF